MNRKAIKLSIPNVGPEEAGKLQECIEKNMVSSGGPLVEEFERLVRDATGARHAVATSAGTTALHAGLHVLGVTPGDLVIMPTLTFIATANAISHCGATPWLLDVSPQSWTLETALLAEVLATACNRNARGEVVHRATGRRVGAIVPVHLLGLPAEMAAICTVAEEWGLPVLADAAAALGSTLSSGDNPANACATQGIGAGRAHLSAISFNANKIVTTGGGGMLVGNDAKLMRRLRHITTTARIRPGYEHDMVGFNYRMTNLQAAVGVAQIAKLDRFLEVKRHIARRYQHAFSNREDLEAFPSAAWGSSNYWLSGVFLRDLGPGQVARIRAQLERANIEAPPFWKPIHLQPPYRDAPRDLTGTAEQVWQQILPLPCSTSLNDAEQDLVIAALQQAT